MSFVGVGLLNNISFPKKFMALGAMVAVAVTVLCSLLMSELLAQREFTHKERVGLQYIDKVRGLLQLVQQHRGASVSVLSGNESFRGLMLEKRQRADQAFNTLLAHDKDQASYLGIEGRAQQAFQSWQQMTQSLGHYTSEDARIEHTQLIERLMDLTDDVADNSNLTADPHLDSYYLMDLSVHHLLHVSEALGRTRALASRIAGTGLMGDDLINLSEIKGAANSGYRSMQKAIVAIEKSNPALGQVVANRAATANQQIEHVLSIVATLMKSDAHTHTPKSVFDATTSAIDQLYALYDTTSPELKTLLGQRLEAVENRIAVVAAIILLLAFGLIYFLACLYMAIQENIAALTKPIKDMASGNLQSRVNFKANDEMRVIADSVNAMATQFSSVVGNTMASAQRVAAAAEQLTLMTEQSNHSITTQHAQTDQVATAIHEMSASIQ